MVPITADVHLFSDPETRRNLCPILYADCAELSGSEKLPVALAKTAVFASKRSKLRKPLLWGTVASSQSRQFVVQELYPKILSTFFDVIVFVLREPNLLFSWPVG
jgi:hypothetical protein